MASPGDPRPRRAGGAARKASGVPKAEGARKAAAVRKASGARKAAPGRPGAPRKGAAPYKAAGAAGKRGGRPDRSDRSDRSDRAGRPERQERGDRRGKATGRPAKGTGRRERAVDPEKEAGRARVERARKAGWGGVARRGARDVTPRKDGAPSASATWRGAVDRARARPEWQPEQWVEVDDVRDEAERAVDRGGRPRQAPSERQLPERRRQPGGAQMAEARDELAKVVGDRQAPKLQQQLADAARNFERERYQDARRMLRTLAERAPGSASVRELYGLTLYRMGQWQAAAKELEAFRTLSGSSEQHPVLADAYRALGRYSDVEELWQELRADSPSAELVAEGRIVAAGALADQGRLAAAISLVEQAKLDVKRPKPHHLRLWYAAADLHERAGDVPRARELFERVRRHEPDFADVADRLAAL